MQEFFPPHFYCKIASTMCMLIKTTMKVTYPKVIHISWWIACQHFNKVLAEHFTIITVLLFWLFSTFEKSCFYFLLPWFIPAHRSVMPRPLTTVPGFKSPLMQFFGLALCFMPCPVLLCAPRVSLCLLIHHLCCLLFNHYIFTFTQAHRVTSTFLGPSLSQARLDPLALRISVEDDSQILPRVKAD